MSVTVTVPNIAGASPSTPTFTSFVNVVMDSSYPTGGEVIGLQAAIGVGKTILGVACYPYTTSSGAPYVARFAYNPTADKLVGFIGAAGVDTEIANTTDLSAVNVVLVVTSY